MKSTINKFNYNGCCCNPEYYNKHGFGTYNNQILMKKPKHMITDSVDDFICIDHCLSKEIKHLWEMGITTTGNCCGHNIKNLAGDSGGYIGVVDCDIDKMLEMGYKTYPGITPDRKDSFHPKTTSDIYNDFW